jgi:thiol-disulfide isomerase/thioredoxin
MRRLKVISALMALPLIGADLPRQAPELKINTPAGTPLKLSQYKGKTVAVVFILTTCPHCQKTIGLLGPLQKEYGPRGFQVIASSIEAGSAMSVPGFVRDFKPPFPVGFNDPSVAVEFMQHPPSLIPHMPMIAFVDRQGVIREQHEGDDSLFFSDQQEQNLRRAIETLLPPAMKSAVKKK